MQLSLRPVLGLLSLVLPMTVSGQVSSPFVAAPGEADVSVTYAYQGIKDLRAGATDATLPGTLGQNTVFVNLNYGVSKRLTFDFLSGYTRSSLTGMTFDGVADTTLGARYAVHQGEHFTATVRADGIIAGSYPLSSLGPFAPGLGANGFLGSLLLGWTAGHGSFFTLENGIKILTNPVPNQYFGDISGGQAFGPFYYMVGFEEDRSLSGTDINAPTFTPRQFNQLKALSGTVHAGVGFTQSNGLSYGFTYAHYVHGRNVGKRAIYAVTLGYRFPGRGPHF